MARLTAGARRGETFELLIEKLGARGDGIAQRHGSAIFVPFAAPGDRVVVEAVAPDRARIVALAAAGAAHTPAPCRHFGNCGGCAVQHLVDDLYVDWKSSLVHNALAKRGLDDVTTASLARTPPGARRRAELAAVHRGKSVTLGFNAIGGASGTPGLVDLEACPVLRPELVALLPALRALIARLQPAAGALDVHATLSESGIDLLLTGAIPLDARSRQACAAFVDAADIARLAWRRAARATPETIALRRPPRMTFGGVAVDLPSGAFLQASAEGERAIVAAVSGACEGARRVADLYCGCGTLALPLAARGQRVRAVEGDAGMLGALDAAARRSALGARLACERRDLVRRPLIGEELDAFNAVIIDPPRQGARAQSEALARSNVPRVVAVSCDPGTFARDARILVDGGYRLTRVVPIDQFLWSPHVELVGTFER